MTLRDKLIAEEIHVNDNIDNYVGHVDREYDIEEHESYVEIAK